MEDVRILYVLNARFKDGSKDFLALCKSLDEVAQEKRRFKKSICAMTFEFLKSFEVVVMTPGVTLMERVKGPKDA